MTKKRVFTISIIAGLIFISLLTVATFYDLQISYGLADLKNGYYSHNFFGRVFETIGEMPVYFLTTFACVVIFWNFKKRRVNALSILFQIFSLFVCFCMMTYMIYKIFKYLSIFLDFSHLLGKITDYIGYAVLGLLFSAMLVYFTKYLSIDFLNKMFMWSFVVVGTAFLSQILAQGIKEFAGRPRFRTMFTIDNFDIYKKWFEFQGAHTPDEEMLAMGVASDGFRSFPSGHSASASMLITITVIPSLFESLDNKKYKIIFWSFASLFTVIVMLSRIVMGAHFLSDVLVGAFLTVISFYISLFVVKLIFKKINPSQLKNKKVIKLVEEKC